MKHAQTLTLDFDGVIHSYSSGWRGAANIPDEPVPGALEFIVKALAVFDVNILSSRSHQWGGRRAMKKWLHFQYYALGSTINTPEWWAEFIHTQSSMEPWLNECDNAATEVVKRIKWPLFKPASVMTIDDRAIQFDGTWPTLDAISKFKPWNRR